MQAAIYNPSHEEVLARRARLGIIQRPKPIFKLVPPAPEPATEAVQPVLDDQGYVPLNMIAPPSWKFLLAYVCLKHSVTSKAILGRDRTSVTVAARFEAVSLVYSHKNLSLPAIGALFGKDHTAILHMVRKTGAKKMPTDTFDGHKSRPLQVRPAHTYRPKEERELNRMQKAVIRGYASGASIPDIAEAYGKSVSSIHMIAYRLGLKHPGYTRSNGGTK